MPDSPTTADTTTTASAGFPPANPDGTPALIGPDDYTRQTRLNRINQNNTTVLSGNIADIQRAGAEIASGDGKSASVPYATPQGIDPKDDKVKTPAQAEADRGEFTRETARTGLLEEPPAAIPADNDEPDSIDPTSVSPEVQAKGSTSTTSSPTPSTATSASASTKK